MCILAVDVLLHNWKDMREFIAYLIKNVVDNPDSVEVSVSEKPEEVLVEVRAAAQDIAKVVGRQGRTIKSLRTIAMVVGARLGMKVRLELIQ